MGAVVLVVFHRRYLQDGEAEVNVQNRQWTVIERHVDDHHAALDVIIRCDRCGQRMNIGENHAIGESGVVRPHIACAVPACGFRMAVYLKGYEFGKKLVGVPEIYLERNWTP